jgi:hypothetical protein
VTARPLFEPLTGGHLLGEPQRKSAVVSNSNPPATGRKDLKMFTRKWLPATAAALMTTAGVVTADSYFGVTGEMEEGTTLTIDNVTAESAGTLDVYDYHTGERGELLASVDLNAGANSDVRVDLDQEPRSDVMAVVMIDGEMAAMTEIEIEDDAM